MTEHHKVVRLFPEIYDIKPFINKDYPVLHPDSSAYSDYWEKEEIKCIQGFWGKDSKGELGGFRFMPAPLYFYINYCVIYDEDEKGKTTGVINPLLRDVEWIVHYGYLVAQGFSGFRDDPNYTSNLIIKKLNSGVELSPKEEILLNKLEYVKKPNGEYKEYVEAKEYLYRTFKKPLGIPIYDNEAKNFLLLSSRGIGKSMIISGIINHTYTFFGKKFYDDTYLIDPAGAEIVVGAAQTSKSSELLKKFNQMQEFLKTGPGSWGKGDEFISGYFYNNSMGSLKANNADSPYRHEYKAKEGGVWIDKGTKTKITHVAWGDNAEAAAGTRPQLMVLEEVGLCFGENTEVRMANGSIKYIQDINIGDLVMGETGKPLYVESLTSGNTEMYKVKQELGEDYIVSKDHILYLEQKCNVKGINDDGYKKIFVQDFNEEVLGKYRHRTTYGIKNDVLKYNTKEILELEPYFLGAWIGDGNSRAPKITMHPEKSKELVEYIKGYVFRLGLNLKYYSKYDYGIIGKAGKKNIILTSLRELNLIKNKHIPHKYLMSSVENRLELLAGLIDTDGNICNKDSSGQCYEFNQTHNKILIDQVAFLAKSLGFRVKIRTRIENTGFGGKILNEYRNKYIVRISGDIWKIPCKLEYKQAVKRKHKKNFNRYKIKVEKINNENYYGFKLKESPLFLLKDGTVVHNCDSLLKVHASSAPCMVRKNKFGVFFMLGTSGNMDKITDSKIIFEDPESYDFVTYPDLWENRIKPTGLFLPAYYRDNSFKDSNGNTDVVKAYAQELLNRKQKEQSTNSMALDGHMMNFPLVPSEMFLSATANTFPTAKLRAREAEIETKNLFNTYASIGDLEWDSVDKKSVKWVEDLSSRRHQRPILTLNLDQYKMGLNSAIVIYEHPPDNIPNPTYRKSLYKVVYDPVKDDNGGSSLASILVYKGFADVGWNAGLQNTIVAEYIGRYDKVDDIHDIALKIAHYFNALILVENNIPGFINYCKMNQYVHKLQLSPYDAISKSGMQTFSRKYDYGVTMNKGLSLHCEQLGRQWLLETWKKDSNDNLLLTLDTLYSLRLIRELIAYDRDGNYDHVSALKLLMLWLSQERDVEIKEYSKENDPYVDLDKFYKQVRYNHPSNKNPWYN